MNILFFVRPLPKIYNRASRKIGLLGYCWSKKRPKRTQNYSTTLSKRFATPQLFSQKPWGRVGAPAPFRKCVGGDDLENPVPPKWASLGDMGAGNTNKGIDCDSECSVYRQWHGATASTEKKNTNLWSLGSFFGEMKLTKTIRGQAQAMT